MTERPLRILLVDDHQDTLKYLALYLEQSGHIVLPTRSKKEAVDTLARSECDVLLSDIALSDGTGWDLLTELNLDRPLFAIAMSGFGAFSDAKRSKAVGYRHHLVKPLDPDLLDRVLEEARCQRDGA